MKLDEKYRKSGKYKFVAPPIEVLKDTEQGQKETADGLTHFLFSR